MRQLLIILLLMSAFGCAGTQEKTFQPEDVWRRVAEPATCSFQCIKGNHCVKMERMDQYYEACLADSHTIDKLLDQCDGSLQIAVHKSVINSSADGNKITLEITPNIPFWECGS